MPCIKSAIMSLRDEYVQNGLAKSFFDINDGLCDEFAEDFAQRLDDPEIMLVEGDMFMIGSDGDPHESEVWDWRLLDEAWDIACPPNISQEEMDRVNFGLHVWITCNEKYYDAECPEGVDSFFDLPIFKRCWQPHAKAA